jgi:3-oxoacyl-[acyl-carrier-protein] synthase-3
MKSFDDLVIKPHQFNLPLKIRGQALILPKTKALTNSEVLKNAGKFKHMPSFLLDKITGIIKKRYGHHKRHLIHHPWDGSDSNEENTYSLSLEATQKALENADTLDRPSAFILGTTTTTHYTGSLSAAVAGSCELLLPTFDTKAGCSTSLYSLHLAATLLEKQYPNILVTCAETLSKVMDPKNYETWLGLADGGASIWLERDEEKPQFKLIESFCCTIGSYAKLFTTPGVLPPKQGTRIYREFILQGDGDAMKSKSFQYYHKILSNLKERNQLENIDVFIPHQVNLEIINKLFKEFEIDQSKLVYDAESIGNIGGSSILYSLVNIIQSHRVVTGQKILLFSVGGGLSGAYQIWQKV